MKTTSYALIFLGILYLFTTDENIACAYVIPRLTAGYYHSVALDGSGTVWAWGYNGTGAVGDGTTAQRNVPVKVTDLDGMTAIAAGQLQIVLTRSRLIVLSE